MSTKPLTTTEHNELPPKPEAPLPSDCCGGGCSPCIYDYYYDALEKWQKTVDELEKQDSSSD